jgi:hypothetical protein
MAKHHTRKHSRKAGRKTRKLTPWNKHVMKVFREMRAKNKGAKFSDALKAAAKRKSEM